MEVPMRRSALAPLFAATVLAACADDPTGSGPAGRALEPAGGPLASLTTTGAAAYPYACGQSLVSSQAAANEQLRAIYEQWTTTRVEWSGSVARVVADANYTYTSGGVTHTLPYGTVSEGQGYGMLLAAFMG